MGKLKQARSIELARALPALALALLGAAAGAQTAPAGNVPAGVAGSRFEPWQEGGLPDGRADTPSLARTVKAMPKNLPRAPGPGLDLAIDAARAGVRACAVKGAQVSVLVADAAGEPVALLSGEGAGVRSQLIARTKANIVVRYQAASGDVVKRAEREPGLNAEAAADPAIGELRTGGFPVMRRGRIAAIVAVSGGSLGGNLDLDEECARVSLDRLEKAIPR